MSDTFDAASVVDLDRYPVDAPRSPAGRALVATCRTRIRADGACPLPGFVRPAVVAEMVAEIEPSICRAHFCREQHNAYLEPEPDPAFAPDHPRNRALSTDIGSIAGDDLAPGSTLERLYRWAPLTAFVAAVLELEQLHLSADPLGAVSVNVLERGVGHAWHFDESPFTVTLLLRPAEHGGAFEYHPDLRTEHHHGYDAVARVLDAAEPDPRTVPFVPGTLLIFAGRHTLHRVTPVSGDTSRLVPVLCYSDRQGSVNSDAVRTLFWGRSEPRTSA